MAQSLRHRARRRARVTPWSGDRRLPGERVAQGPPRADAELGEDLLEVPFDRAGAEEELRADLGVRAPVAREPRDLVLLRRQLVARVVAALAHLLARRQQLVPGALGKPVRAHREQHLARDPQLLARVDPPPRAAQPLPVEQPPAGQLDAHARARETVDRLAVGAI